MCIGSLVACCTHRFVFSCSFFSFLNFTQQNFPDSADFIFKVDPVLNGSFDVIQYVQNWPGQGNFKTCILFEYV